MARKKHHRRKTHHRRRRMSGVKFTEQHKNIAIMFAGGVAGAVAKKFLDTAISKQTAVTLSDTTKKFIDLGEFVLGGGIAIYAKHPFFQGIGMGIGGASAVSGLQKLNMLSGISEPRIPMQQFRKMLENPRPNMSGATKTPNVGQAGSRNTYNFPTPPNVGRARRYDGV